MRISDDARDLAELKYKEQARSIDNTHKQSMASLSLQFARDPGLKDAIVHEFYAMTKEKAETWVSLYLDAYKSEGLIPNAGELSDMGQQVAIIVKKNIPHSPYTPDAAMSGAFRTLPQQLYGDLEDTVKRLELESKIAQKREDQIKESVKSSNTIPAELIPTETIMEFSFIAYPRIRTIVERDYAELQQLDPDVMPKSVLILSGGIIEGLLIDALVKSGEWTEKQAFERFLKDMIHPAKKAGIIKHDNITEVIRIFRNLVHPAREIRDGMEFTVEHAKHARTSVDVVISEVRQWHKIINDFADSLKTVLSTKTQVKGND